MDTHSYAQLKQEIAGSIVADRALLDQLRTEIHPLKSQVHPIRERTTTSVSFVATDGGNTNVQFDPFLVQIVRIVDSNDTEYCLEALTPTTNIADLSAKQFDRDGSPCTALGKLMNYLGVDRLLELSPYIRATAKSHPTSFGWVKAYRELVEWAILFSLVQRPFGSDTIIIYDGLLRSTIFAGNLFQKYLQGIQESIEFQKQHSRRTIYLAGVAKHSKVLSRYRLAMALEGILATTYPAYLAIPPHIEQMAYKWSAYASNSDSTLELNDINAFVGGKMYFVKFGSGARDPIWPVDVFLPQNGKAAEILGCLLTDALNGFPIPLYPLSLQKAHSNAALVDFELDILQNYIFDGIRQVLVDESPTLDVFRLQEIDPSQRRYE
jgi:hypothetical protein